MKRVLAAYWEDMPTSLRYDRIIAAGTSRRAAALFMCSNLPYLAVALLFGCHPELRLPQAAGALCARREPYVLASTALFLVSSFMHLTQLQCGCGCGCWGTMSERSEIRLKQADVACVLTMIAVPVVCARSLLPAWYVAPCLPLFVVSQHYKIAGRAHLYLVWHSVWHVATAAAAWFYVTQHWVAVES